MTIWADKLVMKVVYVSVPMKVRAGHSLRVQFRIWEPGHTQLSDTSAYTATFQMKAVQPPGRVLLSTEEYTGALPSPDGTILTRVEPGHWELFLGKSLTSKLPPTTSFEIKLVNNSNAEDSVPVCTAILKVEPAEVLEIVE